jgi:integrase
MSSGPVPGTCQELLARKKTTMKEAGPPVTGTPLQDGIGRDPAMTQPKTQHRRFGNVRPLPSGRFQARWQGPDGHFHSAPDTFATKEAANVWLAAQMVARDAGRWVDRRVSAQPFGPVAKTWGERRKVSGLRPSTCHRDLTYLDAHIRPKWDDWALDAITADDVEAWFLELGGPPANLSPATVQMIGRLFGDILATAVRSKLLVDNPAQGVARPRDPDPKEMMIVTPAELDALADAITVVPSQRAESRDQWASFVMVGGYCALRAGELLALRACDVDTERRRLHVSRGVTETAGKNYVGPPKTKAGRRQVPYPRALRGPIQDRLDAAQHPEDLLWPNSRGDYQALSVLRSRIWKPATEAVGLVGFRIHDLRHTAISLWIAAGDDPKKIAVRAGHSSVVTVFDRYGHLFDHDDDDPTAGLDSLLARRRRPTGTVTPIR